MEKEIYELLRKFHNQLKEYIGEEEVEEKLGDDQINALETLHRFLYMVEGEFTEF